MPKEEEKRPSIYMFMMTYFKQVVFRIDSDWKHSEHHQPVNELAHCGISTLQANIQQQRNELPHAHNTRCHRALCLVKNHTQELCIVLVH